MSITAFQLQDDYPHYIFISLNDRTTANVERSHTNLSRLSGSMLHAHSSFIVSQLTDGSSFPVLFWHLFILPDNLSYHDYDVARVCC
ncbi:hypothetical protein SAMN04487969_10286 [Paenibacillus algorifonticola]|uniref:Uncharacterized protein n=1 Tax=Paenibacillus algorifonticola TaxID=684063 RepID=A0A1I1ZTS5_9BACL|nr:hypothetical protein SAMN04487969_10286 [Paenibacillus algorifonticola]